MKQKIFIIAGPTASGKTAAAIGTAKLMNAEIISADSIQIYRGLDIGSAKPSVREQDGVPHHLIDCVDIADGSFNVAMFRKCAIEKIHEINSRGKNALIVGGTGLYINALTYPLNFSGAEPDAARREELSRMEDADPGCLHRMLEGIDPEKAARLHVNDRKRIIRAIEIFEQTGETASAHVGDFSNERGAEIEFDPVIAALCFADREKLYDRIERRVDLMLENGLLDEVKAIAAKGYDRSLPALQGLGYKQLLMYLDGEISLDEAVELIKRDTRRFAKRQISWFKRDKRIRNFYADLLTAEELVQSLYEYFTNPNQWQENARQTEQEDKQSLCTEKHTAIC